MKKIILIVIVLFSIKTDAQIAITNRFKDSTVFYSNVTALKYCADSGKVLVLDGNCNIVPQGINNTIGAWLLRGNTGTNSSINYCGTTDGVLFNSKSFYTSSQFALLKQWAVPTNLTNQQTSLTGQDSIRNIASQLQYNKYGFSLSNQNFGGDSQVVINGFWRTYNLSIEYSNSSEVNSFDRFIRFPFPYSASQTVDVLGNDTIVTATNGGIFYSAKGQTSVILTGSTTYASDTIVTPTALFDGQTLYVKSTGGTVVTALCFKSADGTTIAANWATGATLAASSEKRLLYHASTNTWY